MFNNIRFYGCIEGIPAGEVSIRTAEGGYKSWVITPTVGYNNGGLTQFAMHNGEVCVTANETETETGGTVWFENGGCKSASCEIPECGLPESGYISATWITTEEGELTNTLEVWGVWGSC